MKGKSKSKGDKIHKKQNLKNEEIHEGAIEMNKLVKVVFKTEGNNTIWELGKIIEISQLDNKKTKESYKYYITFINYNRRNDCWRNSNQIIDDDSFVKEELKKKEEREKDQNIFNVEEHKNMDEETLRAHEEATKVKTILEIEIGKFRTNCWYYSPYPEGYHVPILYLCEFCFAFYVEKIDLIKHCEGCPYFHPPGNEIYRDVNISVFEVDGKKEVTYCENLCYLSKLFLDHKTLSYDVEPFLFYILCEYDQYGYHFIGYFSKEKESQNDYNVACILAMPFFQGKGWGKFLIDFSYLLSRVEGKIGSPEEPLSDLGFAAYYSYWTQALCKALKNCKEQVSVQDLAKMTAIKPDNIMRVLEELNLIRYKENNPYIMADPKILDELYKKAGNPGHPVIPDKLVWTPYKNKYEFS